MFRCSASGDTLCWIESGKPDPAKIFGEKPKGPMPLSAYLQTAIITGLAMAFKLMMSAQNKWRKLDGANRMPEIIEGITFKDGIKQLNQAA